MADSDGEYVNNMSDDDFLDHQVTSNRGGGRRGNNHHNNSTTASRSRQGGVGGGGGGGGGGRRTRKKDKQSKAKWEEVTRSWEDLDVEAEGAMKATITEVREHEKRMRLLRDTTPLQRGIIRHLVLVLDMSFAMLEKDMLPNRYRLMMNYALKFVREFFEQNPISQLGIVGMRDGRAIRISDVSGSVEQHVEELLQWRDDEPLGNPSLQNAFEMCRGVLYHAPSHGTREVLVVYGALMSIDPGDIHDTIGNLIKDGIRVSIVGLAAQVALCQELCRKTNAGDDSQYSVATSKEHFESLLLSATTPPVARTREHAKPSLLQMGFPSRTVDKPDSAVILCVCHNQPLREGYRCTRCGAKVCRLPVECPSCSLTLILSTHLARSYHHLFPLKTWREVSWTEAAKSTACFSCHHTFPHVLVDKQKGPLNRARNHGRGGGDGHKEKDRPRREGVSESGRYACRDCGQHFCIDCDVYAHEVIHNCPGCQSLPPSLPAKSKEKLTNVAAANGNAGATGAMILD
ncbi:putative tfiih basal transcription factor complex p47 subunit protein [Zalerion maritima]|uniref:General transcription and DNA repair factor IIH n=1 Tax=Zalerion maritima TaxID=339359 RepID=A0AAD5RLM6_9PEZI|nr:putative tfiih basal transcription factor complex p47 subunit protein [Zalerion maritima]